MPLNYDVLINTKIDGLEHRYTDRDTILYALSVGLGHDPTDERQLRFVYEKSLQALPTMATILAYPWGWLYRPDTGITRGKHVLGAQGVRLYKPVTAAGHVIANLRVANIVDKGPDKGALVFTERDIRDAASGELICTVTTTMFCRADGGFGGPAGPVPAPIAIPQRVPDRVCDLPTIPQAALLYRLNGDRNLLHVDPSVAAKAGFRAPILHGLCTFGIAGHAVLQAFCDYDPSRMKSIDARFSAPVYPGEELRTEMWNTGRQIAFRTSSIERNVVVLNHGIAELNE
ncbi:MAG: MaoC/PaaZ C-terminal domain-containing protein [Rhodospirillaceae bacterium]